MQQSKKVKLPSGAELLITMGTFAESRALYQAILEEVKGLEINGEMDIDYNLLKDLFCTGLSSKKIEQALEVCMKRVTYNGKRISEDTFEPVEARQDYILACYEVAQENIAPFMKSLYAQYAPILEKLKSAQA